MAIGPEVSWPELLNVRVPDFVCVAADAAATTAANTDAAEAPPTPAAVVAAVFTDAGNTGTAAKTDAAVAPTAPAAVVAATTAVAAAAEVLKAGVAPAGLVTVA